MKKNLMLLIVTLSFLTLSLNSIAQVASGKLTGTVTDESQKGLESATVSLLKLSDCSLVKMSITDKAGNFSFENMKEGKYLVLVTAVGHSKSYSEPFELNAATNPVDLKSISLKTQSKDLKEVSVVSRKPLIEQKIDRTIVNVEAAVTNVGASALEVLEKSPGITVDKDGNISLKGKQGVQVYIDGGHCYLSGQDIASLLTNISARQLD